MNRRFLRCRSSLPSQLCMVLHIGHLDSYYLLLIAWLIIMVRMVFMVVTWRQQAREIVVWKAPPS